MQPPVADVPGPQDNLGADHSRAEANKSRTRRRGQHERADEARRVIRRVSNAAGHSDLEADRPLGGLSHSRQYGLGGSRRLALLAGSG